MQQVPAYLIVIVLSYLLGSFPSGYLVSRSQGVDIRREGSGNIGATNVLRVVGKRWGYLVFLLDSLKGLLAVRIALALAHNSLFLHPELPAIVAAVACVAGHNYPIWLSFRGGKGVATSAGVVLGLMPLAMVSVFVIWITLFYLTRYVSIASVGAAISLPLFVALYLRAGLLSGVGLLVFSIVIALAVIWRHRTNFQRLLQGTEQRFGNK